MMTEKDHRSHDVSEESLKDARSIRNEFERVTVLGVVWSHGSWQENREKPWNS